MKLSEYKNEEALDLLVDLLDPAMEIIGDNSVRDMARAGKRNEAIKHAIKEHKTAVIKILARIDGIPYEKYECSVITLPAKLIELLNDKEMMDFFASQAPKTST